MKKVVTDVDNDDDEEEEEMRAMFLSFTERLMSCVGLRNRRR